MSNIFISIKESLIHLLKNKYPAIDVFAEEISKTDDEDDQLDIDDYFFLDISPLSNTTIDEYHTQRNVFIDIVCHIKSELNREYLDIGNNLDTLIRPVFRFEDRAITIDNGSYRVVDCLLHYTFNIIFTDSALEPEELPYMTELDHNTKAN